MRYTEYPDVKTVEMGDNDCRRIIFIEHLESWIEDNTSIKVKSDGKHALARACHALSGDGNFDDFGLAFDELKETGKIRYDVPLTMYRNICKVLDIGELEFFLTISDDTVKMSDMVNKIGSNKGFSTLIQQKLYENGGVDRAIELYLKKHPELIEDALEDVLGQMSVGECRKGYNALFNAVYDVYEKMKGDAIIK